MITNVNKNMVQIKTRWKIFDNIKWIKKTREILDKKSFNKGLIRIKEDNAKIDLLSKFDPHDEFITEI